MGSYQLREIGEAVSVLSMGVTGSLRGGGGMNGNAVCSGAALYQLNAIARRFR